MKFTIRHLMMASFIVSCGFTIWMVTQRQLLHQGDGFKVQRLSAWLESRDENNPFLDAKQYFKKGDNRYLFHGGSRNLPGVPMDELLGFWERKKVADRFTGIPGTTDFFESSFHVQLNRRAYDYALKYNKEIHSLIKAAHQ